MKKVSARKLPTGWRWVELREVLEYEQPTKYLVNNTYYNGKFKIPVLTAGKSFILGYTNESHGIFTGKLPVIIFDDFTTATKFVDFSFKVKSSAMKILHPKKELVNPWFVFFAMQTIEFDSTTHKRYWISEYSKIKISLPLLATQDEIVAKLGKQLASIKRMQQAVAQQNDAVSALSQAYLRKALCPPPPVKTKSYARPGAKFG